MLEIGKMREWICGNDCAGGRCGRGMQDGCEVGRRRLAMGSRSGRRRDSRSISCEFGAGVESAGGTGEERKVRRSIEDGVLCCWWAWGCRGVGLRTIGKAQKRPFRSLRFSLRGHISTSRKIILVRHTACSRAPRRDQTGLPLPSIENLSFGPYCGVCSPAGPTDCDRHIDLELLRLSRVDTHAVVDSKSIPTALSNREHPSPIHA